MFTFARDIFNCRCAFSGNINYLQGDIMDEKIKLVCSSECLKCPERLKGECNFYIKYGDIIDNY